MFDLESQRVASTKIRKIEGEYVVRAYNPDGVRIPQADYYTTDKQDAEVTAKLMIKLQVSQAPHMEGK